MSKNPYHISKDRQVGNLQPFKLTEKSPFALCYLKSVKAVMDYRTSGGAEYPILEIQFVDDLDNPTFGHTERLKEPTKAEYFKYVADKIQTIYQVFKDIPEKGLGAGATDFESFIKAIDKDFNKKVDGSTIFEGVRVWLKLTANEAGFYNLPISNFLELYQEGKPPTKLSLLPRDVIDARKAAQTSKSAPITGVGGGGDDDPFADVSGGGGTYN